MYIFARNRKYLRTVVLYRFCTDIGEVVQVRVVMVHIRDGGEVQSRDMVLHKRKISKIRHNPVHHRGKRIGKRRFCTSGIKVHHPAVARAGLEQKARTPRASRFKVDYQADIVELLPVVFPYCGHSVEFRLLRIGEEHLHTLVPVCTVPYQVPHGLQGNPKAVAVVRRAV